MRITFIGSSHGVPEANRKCTSMMLEIGEKVYFVDMGAPAIDALRTRGIDVDAVKGVFITHMHGDHTDGLIQFVDLLTWYFRTADPVICLPIPEAARVIDDWLKVTLNGQTRDVQYRKTEQGVVYDDGTIKMTAFPTQHCHKSYAYLLEAEGKRVLFTGDLKNPAVDFPTRAAQEPLDLVICESAHFNATDYLPVLEGCDIKKICVTHYSDTYLVSVMEFTQAMREKGVEALRATDDLVLKV